MVLRILNIEEQQNGMIGSKSYNGLKNVFSKIGMWGVYPGPIDWNIVLRTEILIWASIYEV